MKQSNGRAFGRIWWYLLIILGLSVFCFLTLNLWLISAVVLWFAAERKEKKDRLAGEKV